MWSEILDILSMLRTLPWQGERSMSTEEVVEEEDVVESVETEEFFP